MVKSRGLRIQSGNRAFPLTLTGELEESANIARDLAEDGGCRREGRAGADAAFAFEHHAGHLPAVRTREPTTSRRQTQQFGELNCDQL